MLGEQPNQEKPRKGHDTAMNILGAEGWELVSSLDYSTTVLRGGFSNSVDMALISQTGYAFRRLVVSAQGLSQGQFRSFWFTLAQVPQASPQGNFQRSSGRHSGSPPAREATTAPSRLAKSAVRTALQFCDSPHRNAAAKASPATTVSTTWIGWPSTSAVIFADPNGASVLAAGHRRRAPAHPPRPVPGELPEPGAGAARHGLNGSHLVVIQLDRIRLGQKLQHPVPACRNRGAG